MPQKATISMRHAGVSKDFPGNSWVKQTQYANVCTTPDRCSVLETQNYFYREFETNFLYLVKQYDEWWVTPWSVWRTTSTFSRESIQFTGILLKRLISPSAINNWGVQNGSCDPIFNIFCGYVRVSQTTHNFKKSGLCSDSIYIQ